MNIASYIEHTALKPTVTKEDVETLCLEAAKWSFGAICVNSSYAALAHTLLKGTTVRVTVVVGFPLGAMATEIKAAEAKWAVIHGADEIDMVQALGAVKSGDWEAVEADIAAVVNAADGLPVKVILETGVLTDEEKRRSCLAAVQSGATYVKTSTGFGYGGATVADVTLMRQTIGAAAGIKASGGIRDKKTALAMIAAGANRIGTSSGVAIMTEPVV